MSNYYNNSFERDFIRVLHNAEIPTPDIARAAGLSRQSVVSKIKAMSYEGSIHLVPKFSSREELREVFIKSEDGILENDLELEQFEIDFLRICMKGGVSATEIAIVLHRDLTTIRSTVKALRTLGTMDDIPHIRSKHNIALMCRVMAQSIQAKRSMQKE